MDNRGSTQTTSQTRQIPFPSKQYISQSQEQNFNFKHDNVNCHLKIEMVNCKLPEVLFFSGNDGTNLYYVTDQQVIEQGDGNYQLEYENEQGQTEKFPCNNIQEQRAIKITGNFDGYCYIGMITPNEINQIQRYMNIDDVFEELSDDLKHSEHFNTEQSPIYLNLNGKIKALSKMITIEINKQTVQHLITWYLIRVKTQEIVINSIIEINKIIKDNQKQLEDQQQKNKEEIKDSQKTENKQILDKLKDITEDQSKNQKQVTDLLEIQNQTNKKQWDSLEKKNKKIIDELLPKITQDQLNNQNQVNKSMEEQNQNNKEQWDSQEKHNKQILDKLSSIVTENQSSVQNQNKQLNMITENQKINQKQIVELESIIQQQQQSNQDQFDKQVQQNENSFKNQDKLLKEIQQEIRTQFQQLKDYVFQLSTPQLITIQQLKERKEYFYLMAEQVTGVIKLQFSILDIPHYGFVVGLNNSTNIIENKPTFGIYLSQSTLMIGKTEIFFTYEPQVDDQICFSVDMIQRMVVLQVNAKQTVQFKLDEQRELYFCIGYFNESEEITDFIE